jgi:hypothetical protein
MAPVSLIEEPLVAFIKVDLRQLGLVHDHAELTDCVARSSFNTQLAYVE